MAKYRISGIWKDDNNVITHYAVHTESKDNKVSRAKKTSKADAVKLLDGTGDEAVTWLWDYSKSKWSIGGLVHVVNGSSGKYLRSDHDNKSFDNLGHLIDYDWIRL